MESEKVAADESSDADVAAPAAREERAAKTSRPKKRREGRRVEPRATGASSLVAVVIALVVVTPW